MRIVPVPTNDENFGQKILTISSNI